MLERQRPSLPGQGVPVGPLTLAPFLSLARDLAAMFVPIPMRTEFRDALEESLMIAARQQQARTVLILPAARREPGASEWLSERLDEALADRRWVVGAALGSAVSIAGIVAIVRRYRGQNKAA